MKRAFSIALAAACLWAASSRLNAQAPAGSNTSGSSQNQPAAAQKPGGNTPRESNPFPEDTSSVPVMPTASSPAAPPPAFNAADSGSIHLPGADSDPVRSPDDPAATSGSSQRDGFSSSLQGIDQMIQPPPDTGKRDAKDQVEVMPHAGPTEDISVGAYYLQTHNWKGALSRFESALVLAPDNPEVYWGLAEAQRHLGNYSAAKANYLKVMEYDPDSRHSKDARKILKQPEMANVPAVSATSPAAQPRQ